MPVSNDLVSQLVKTLNNDSSKTKTNTDSTVYGTVVYDGKTWVKLDGSDLLTPVTTTVDVADGDRVSVTIKDHQATVTGNYTDPSASGKTVSSNSATISEFGSVIAYKVTTEDFAAVNGSIDNLYSKLANIGELDAEKLKAIEADIESLRASYIESEEIDVKTLNAIRITVDKIAASFGEFTDIDTETLNAINAEITNLRAYTAEISHLNAVKAYVKDLDAKKISAEQADIKYANIDFANIGEAAFKKLFADSGLIRDLVVGDSTITGELVGVTIKGDLIEAGTLKADRLVVKGSDGNYYKLDTNFEAMPGVEPVEEDAIHGSILVAKSLTAEKVAVDDLVAFDATIGGFNITDKSLYSGVKSSVDNTTRGVYMDTDAQFSIGDSESYLRYRRIESVTPTVTDGVLKVTSENADTFSSSISDAEIRVTSRDSSLVDVKMENDVLRASSSVYKLEIVAERIETQLTRDIEKRFTFHENGLTISSGENSMSLVIDNDMIMFEKNGVTFGWWDGIDFHTGNIQIEVSDRAQFGNFAFVPRTDGSLSLLKVDHKAGFYAILRGRMMVLYGAYPTLVDNALVITNDKNDPNYIPAKHDSSTSTLILNGGE